MLNIQKRIDLTTHYYKNVPVKFRLGSKLMIKTMKSINVGNEAQLTFINTKIKLKNKIKIYAHNLNIRFSP